MSIQNLVTFTERPDFYFELVFEIVFCLRAYPSTLTKEGNEHFLEHTYMCFNALMSNGSCGHMVFLSPCGGENEMYAASWTTCYRCCRNSNGGYIFK